MKPLETSVVNPLIKPAKLEKGDHVAVIAPASSPDKEAAEQAILLLQQMGLEVEIGSSLKREYGYLAGTDQQRVEEFHEAFLNPKIKAIFCVCGGYGTARIASLIDYELIRSNPKIFWGYSDITFLLHAIYQKTGLITFHGPMLSSDLSGDVHPLTRKTFEQLFHPTSLTYSESLRPIETLVDGYAEGPVVGGNLTLLASSIGTEFEIDCKNKILFLEDVDEEPYRIDRLLTQLKLAGKLVDARAILLCDFHNCVPPVKRQNSLSLEQLFQDHIVPFQKPTLRGFPIGHCSPNVAVPIGITASVNTEERTIVFKESGIAE
ncbi:LD-carboxypeptidase [Alkalihalobacillus sp. MEB130]|uniref:S66 peptidase family protein n=1 Tax=Alkalihalobacillus sp. MEB130 TaxID=2976704 RepID=UPI0028E01B6B|nr:LD-carboxypeptidase [Alkalihalobacillus sp. MEB130]MDT8861879.1 LD-carboxypeptidase [Alkalihalobacillus sp. MEB130]